MAVVITRSYKAANNKVELMMDWTRGVGEGAADEDWRGVDVQCPEGGQ